MLLHFFVSPFSKIALSGYFFNFFVISLFLKYYACYLCGNKKRITFPNNLKITQYDTF